MKKATFFKALALTTLLACSASQASTLDLHLNNDAVNVDFTTRITESELNIGAGLLHHQDNGDVYYGSIFVADNVNKQAGILAGVGGRVYYIDADRSNDSGTAIGLGGFFNWEIPSVPNLSIRSDLYYAPDVLSFDEVNKYLDFSARIQYRIIEQAWLYVGYRNAEAKPDKGSTQTIDEGGHLGLLLWF